MALAMGLCLVFVLGLMAADILYGRRILKPPCPWPEQHRQHGGGGGGHGGGGGGGGSGGGGGGQPRVSQPAYQPPSPPRFTVPPPSVGASGNGNGNGHHGPVVRGDGRQIP
jgi:hypothetical protein